MPDVSPLFQKKYKTIMVTLFETKIFNKNLSKKCHSDKNSIPISAWSINGLVAYTLNNNHISIFHPEQPALIYNYNLDVIRKAEVHKIIRPNLFLYDGENEKDGELQAAMGSYSSRSNNNIKKRKITAHDEQNQNHTKNHYEFVTNLQFRRYGQTELLIVATSQLNVYLLTLKNCSISYLLKVDHQNYLNLDVDRGNHYSRNQENICIDPVLYDVNDRRYKTNTNKSVEDCEIQILDIKFIEMEERWTLDEVPEDSRKSHGNNVDYQVNLKNYDLIPFHRTSNCYPLNFDYGSRFGYIMVLSNGKVMMKSFNWDDKEISLPLISISSLKNNNNNEDSQFLNSADISIACNGTIMILTTNSPKKHPDTKTTAFFHRIIIDTNTLDNIDDFSENADIHVMLYHTVLRVHEFAPLMLAERPERELSKIKIAKFINQYRPDAVILVTESDHLFFYRIEAIGEATGETLKDNYKWELISETAAARFDDNYKTDDQTDDKREEETIESLQISPVLVPAKKMFQLIKQKFKHGTFFTITTSRALYLYQCYSLKLIAIEPLAPDRRFLCCMSSTLSVYNFSLQINIADTNNNNNPIQTAKENNNDIVMQLNRFSIYGLNMESLITNGFNFSCLGYWCIVNGQSYWEFASVVNSMQTKYGQSCLELASSGHYVNHYWERSHISRKYATENSVSLNIITNLPREEWQIYFEGLCLIWIRTMFCTLNKFISLSDFHQMQKLYLIDDFFDKQLSARHAELRERCFNIPKSQRAQEMNHALIGEDFKKIKEGFLDINNYLLNKDEIRQTKFKFYLPEKLTKFKTMVDQVFKVCIYVLKETSTHGMLGNLFHRQTNTDFSLADHHAKQLERFMLSAEDQQVSYLDSRTGFFSQARALKIRIIAYYARVLILYIYHAIKANPACAPTLYTKHTTPDVLESLGQMWRLMTFFWLELYHLTTFERNEIFNFKMECELLFKENDPSFFISTKPLKDYTKFSFNHVMELVAENKIELPIRLELNEETLRKFAEVGKYRPDTYDFKKNGLPFELHALANQPNYLYSPNLRKELQNVSSVLKKSCSNDIEQLETIDDENLKIDLPSGHFVPNSNGKRDFLWDNSFNTGLHGFFMHLISKPHTVDFDS